MLPNEILTAGHKLWDFLVIKDELRPIDGLILFGSDDMRIPELAAQIYKALNPEWIIITGGRGERTAGWNLTEAETFADILVESNVPEERIYLDKCAANTLENVLFAAEIIKSQNIPAETIGLIAKDFLQRRAFLTASRHMNASFINLPPETTLEDRLIERPRMIERLAKEIVRIKKYGIKGDVSLIEIPPAIELAAAHILNYYAYSQ